MSSRAVPARDFCYCAVCTSVWAGKMLGPFQWHSQLEILGGEYLEFTRATVFGLGHRGPKHKAIRYARNLGRRGPFAPPGYACGPFARNFRLNLIQQMQ